LKETPREAFGGFRGKKALAAYTEETHKFFGRDIAKQDKVLRVLLRKLQG
jgi:hypothetical protein